MNLQIPLRTVAIGAFATLIMDITQRDRYSSFDLGGTCLRHFFGSLAMVPVFPSYWPGKDGASCLAWDGDGTGKLSDSCSLWTRARNWSRNVLMNIGQAKKYGLEVEW